MMDRNQKWFYSHLAASAVAGALMTWVSMMHYPDAIRQSLSEGWYVVTASFGGYAIAALFFGVTMLFRSYRHDRAEIESANQLSFRFRWNAWEPTRIRVFSVAGITFVTSLAIFVLCLPYA